MRILQPPETYEDFAAARRKIDPSYYRLPRAMEKKLSNEAMRQTVGNPIGPLQNLPQPYGQYNPNTMLRTSHHGDLGIIDPRYYEAQIHGPVSMDDVEGYYLTQPFKYIYEGAKPNRVPDKAALEKLLEKYGSSKHFLGVKDQTYYDDYCTGGMVR